VCVIWKPQETASFARYCQATGLGPFTRGFGPPISFLSVDAVKSSK
jgi:hypothetical protein